MQKGSIKRTRLSFEQNFVQIPNDWMRDDRLSMRARGVLGVLLSHQAGWRVAINDLTTRKADGTANEGRDAIITAIRELTALGYLTRERARDAKGRLTASDWVLQEPEIPPKSPHTD